jgi:hypothetical protein
MKLLHRGAIGLAVVAACGLAAQLPAQAAPDNTPPVLDTPLKARFVVGTQLDQYTIDDEYFYNVPELIKWSGSDNSGLIYYSVWEYLAGDEPGELTDFTEETSFTVSGTDYDDQFGGGSFTTTNWSIQAHDVASNSVERAVYGAYVTVLQDDNAISTLDRVADVSVDYTGTWQTALCGCFAAGSTHKTSAPGAAADIHVAVPASEGVRKIGLVMEKAPGRGKAQVFVDGVLKATVDTVAAAPKHQVVVWQGTLSTGHHVVKVVNLATPGRSRIDLDAVVVN